MNLQSKPNEMPMLRIHGQYIKDFSFESPNSPSIFLAQNNDATKHHGPKINVAINIACTELNADDKNAQLSFYEVVLHIDINATLDEQQESAEKPSTNTANAKTAFLCEIKYCGVFSIERSNALSAQDTKRFLLIKAPSLLFPFAREIIARNTGSGGFPPLMLDLIDFEAMYNNQTQSSGGNETKSSDTTSN